MPAAGSGSYPDPNRILTWIRPDLDLVHPYHGGMVRLSWPGWLGKYCNDMPAKVTHLSTNPAKRRVTSIYTDISITSEWLDSIVALTVGNVLFFILACGVLYNDDDGKDWNVSACGESPCR